MKEKILQEVVTEEIKSLIPESPNLWPRIHHMLRSGNQIVTTKARPIRMRNAFLIAGVGLIMLTVFFWQPWLTPVSAKQILIKAGDAWMAQLDGADYLYQRLQVSGSDTAMMPSGTAEIWRSIDSQYLRFELRNNQGQLLYFLLQNRDGLWLSLNMDPILTSPTSTIYRSSIEGQATKINNPFSIFGLLGLAEPTQDCFSLECFLESLSAYQLNTEPMIVTEELDGVDVFSIQWINQIPVNEGSEETWDQIWGVKIDSQDFRLIQFTNPYGHCWKLLEYQGILSKDISSDIFNTFPEGIQVLDDWQDLPENQASDSLWVVSIIPSNWDPNTHIQRFLVEIGYQLETRPEAIITLKLDPTLVESGDLSTQTQGVRQSDGAENIIAFGEGVEILELALVLDHPWEGQTIPLWVYLFTHDLGILGATYDIFSSINITSPIIQ